MERYSNLYSAHTIETPSGKKVNQYIEAGRSAGLDAFLKKQNIPNPITALDDVNKTLTGFTELPGYGEQPMACKPMLVRYAPIYLKRLEGYENNVLPFNAIACSGLDHQVGNRGGNYRNTHIISKSLLLKSGEYNYLDQIFGTHLVTWQENLNARAYPINYDAPPAKVMPVQNPKDSLVVKVAAAAIYNKFSVVLRLENDCLFQERSMDLLKQIYGLFIPALAAEIGFSSYEDPKQIPQLIAKTSIRLFVVPGTCDTSVLNGQDNLLLLDLNQPIRKPSANDLLRMVEFWYKYDWKERQSVMEQLFADLRDPYDVMAFVEHTRAFKENPFHIWKESPETKNSVESLAELKKKFDSFGSIMAIPVMYEHFRKAVPRVMKLPDDRRMRVKTRQEYRTQLFQWLKEELEKLGTEAAKGQVPEKKALFDFCCELFSTDRNMYTVLVASYMKAQKEQEFADEREAIIDERKSFTKRIDEAVAAEKRNTDLVKAELLQEKMDRQAEEERLKKEHEAALTNLTTQMTNAKNEALRVQSEAHSAAIKEKNDVIAGLQKQVDDHNALLEQKEQAYKDALEQKVKEHRIALEAEQLKTQAETSRANAAEQQAAQEKTRADQTESKLKEKRIALTLVESKLSTAEKERTEANTKQATAEAERKKAQDDLEKEKGDNTALKAKVDEQQKTIDDLISGKIEMINLLGKKIPKIAVKPMAIFAAVALSLGLILGGLLGAVIGGKGAEEPTVPQKTITETVPEPTQTASTVPVTESPTASTIPEEVFVDGEINWQYVYTNVLDVNKVESESGKMEDLLNQMNITAAGDDQDLAAVIKVVGSKSDNPTFLTVRRILEEPNGNNENGQTTVEESNRNNEDSQTTGQASDENEAGSWTNEEESVPQMVSLNSMDPTMRLSNGAYCIEVYYHFGEGFYAVTNNAVSAAQKIFRMITEDDAPVGITLKTADETELDLHALMGTVTENELWWRESFKLDMRENKLLDMQNVMDSSSVPVMLLYYNGAETVIYDYTDRSSRKDAMVTVLEEKGFSASYVGNLVIGVKTETHETGVGTAQNP